MSNFRLRKFDRKNLCFSTNTPYGGSLPARNCAMYDFWPDRPKTRQKWPSFDQIWPKVTILAKMRPKTRPQYPILAKIEKIDFLNCQQVITFRTEGAEITHITPTEIDDVSSPTQDRFWSKIADWCRFRPRLPKSAGTRCSWGHHQPWITIPVDGLTFKK